MKIQVACVTSCGLVLALIASPISRAAGCSLPERGLVLASLTSVAAPEMFAPGAQEQACLSAQQLIALTTATTPAVVDGSGYVPKTPYDNTPWRFNMNQNGKRMTAEEFDAWMKAKGIHVATGKPGTTAVPDGGACLPSASVSC